MPLFKKKTLSFAGGSEKKTTVKDLPDVALEQLEPGYTTVHSPDAVKDAKLVRKDPQNYLEVNIVRTSRIVDSFAVPIRLKNFHYKKKSYSVDEKFVYLLPTKHGYLMPTSFYKEDNIAPVRFLNTNKGITGKALSLLYMEQLYSTLLAPEEDKYNLFIVILSVALLVCYAVGCYFVFFHNGGIT